MRAYSIFIERPIDWNERRRDVPKPPHFFLILSNTLVLGGSLITYGRQVSSSSSTSSFLFIQINVIYIPHQFFYWVMYWTLAIQSRVRMLAKGKKITTTTVVPLFWVEKAQKRALSGRPRRWLGAIILINRQQIPLSLPLPRSFAYYFFAGTPIDQRA